jgi:hypothetical protein
MRTKRLGDRYERSQWRGRERNGEREAERGMERLAQAVFSEQRRTGERADGGLHERRHVLVGDDEAGGGLGADGHGVPVVVEGLELEARRRHREDEGEERVG